LCVPMPFISLPSATKLPRPAMPPWNKYREIINNQEKRWIETLESGDLRPALLLPVLPVQLGFSPSRAASRGCPFWLTTINGRICTHC